MQESENRDIEELKKNLEKELLPNSQDIGYCVKGAHFKVGDKFHSEYFYHVKPFFQNSDNAKKLAKTLAEKIKKSKIAPPIVLIGYGMYSELILSLVEKILITNYPKKEEEVNHFVVKNEDGKMTFLPQKAFYDYINNKQNIKCENSKIIIIVPIAVTGNTAKKIKSEIQKLYKEKTSKEKNDENFILYNILLAQPDLEQLMQEKRLEIKEIKKRLEGQESIIKRLDLEQLMQKKRLEIEEINEIKKTSEGQESIIRLLPPKWQGLEDCKFCYGDSDDSENTQNTRPLFDMDEVSFMPSLIFGNPKGKEQDESKNVEFDGLKFLDSEIAIDYRSVARNDNYRIYSIDPYKLIKNNEEEIKEWLEKIVKKRIEIDPNQENLFGEKNKIVIIAPNHESNSKLINLINENVFSSKATIIHYENGVDSPENFSLLNKKFLTSDSKFFYVDDSLITGKHFFELYDLIRGILPDKPEQPEEPFTASIFLTDEAEPFIHDRVNRRSSGKLFAFASINTPPTINLKGKSQLDHERNRYKSLQENASHDTLRKYFRDKAEKLDPKKKKAGIENESSIKNIRHLKMFEATHKIYDYFIRNEKIPDLTKLEERKKFVNFALEHETFDKKEEVEEKALLKVLSLHPFISYKELREQTFKWHKQELDKLLEIPNEEYFDINRDYDKFTEFKFLLRRAVSLDNYQVLGEKFLNKLAEWFNKIGSYEYISDQENQEKEKNLLDFHIFVLGSYIEMIQKNAWVAVRLMKNIKKLKLEEEGLNSKLWKRFFRMLIIEAAAILTNDYVKSISSEWQNIEIELNYEKDMDKLYSSFLRNKDKRGEMFKKNNKYTVLNRFLEVEKGILSIRKIHECLRQYMLIKTMVYKDNKDLISSKEGKKYDYQDKINYILKIIEKWFGKKDIYPFFIVTDKENKPYVLYDDKSVLRDLLEEEYEHYKNPKNSNPSRVFKSIEVIKFLEGIDVSNIATKTMIGYKRCSDKIWVDENDEKAELKFLSDKDNYLLLIRLSYFRKEKGVFTPSGILGFYGKDIIEENLPKQLLMLLRNDINEFIYKHHKNDEFSALRLAQQAKRLAFLAGHGRLTMQQVAHINNGETFGDVISTMEKLQYIFAVKLIENEGNTKTVKEEAEKVLLQDSFYMNYPKYEDLKQKIKCMSKEIYKSKYIENEVRFKRCNVQSGFLQNNDEIKINKDILEMICFELIINAKKNRWNEEDEIKGTVNSLSFDFEKEKKNSDEYILIKVTSIGPRIYDSAYKNIKEGKSLKPDYEVSGLDLIRKVAEKLYDGELDFDYTEIAHTVKYKNTMIVKLKLR
jgi:hypothetical protein